MIDNDRTGLRVAGTERTGWCVLGEFTVPAAAHEVKGVRRRPSALLPSAYEAVHDDVLLLTAELVGNALRHSRSPTIGILLAARDDAVHVAVTDAGTSGTIPRVVDLGPDAESGRGLRMVDTLTSGRWGTFLTDVGRVVWFEKALTTGPFGYAVHADRLEPLYLCARRLGFPAIGGSRRAVLGRRARRGERAQRRP